MQKLLLLVSNELSSTLSFSYFHFVLPSRASTFCLISSWSTCARYSSPLGQLAGTCVGAAIQPPGAPGMPTQQKGKISHTERMSNLGWITINSLNYIITYIIYQIESFNTVESCKFVGGGGNFHSCQILFSFSQCHLDLLASMKRGIYTDSIYCMKQRSKLFLKL